MATPLTRRAAGPIGRTPRSAWIALGLALLVTSLAWLTVTRSIAAASADRFAFRRTEAQSAIAARLAAYEQVLFGALGFLKASQAVTAGEWRVYVTGLRLESRFPGVQGVGYARWIDPAALDAAIAEQRASGRPDFRVWPEGSRSAYTAIIHLEPANERNQRAIGFDMWSEAVRREAMTKARDSGAPAVSGRVRLVQETEKDFQYGFLVYLPHYGPAAEPASLSDRRARLEGFVYAPFRMGDFMAPVAAADLHGLRLRILDGPPAAATDDPATLYDSHPDRPWPDREAGPVAVTTLDLPGRVWTLEWAAPPEAAGGAYDWTPPLILAVGLLFGALGFTALRNAAGLRYAADQNASLGRIIEEAATEVYVLDARDLRILQANRGARRNLGRDDDLSGLTLLDIQTDLDRDRFAALTRSLRRGSGHVTYAARHRRQDGSTYDVEVTLQLHPTSRPPIYHALVVDVTDRRRAEAALNASLAESRGLLAEKETLLKEIHHRVKNNLQVIWSLIRLEATDIKDPAVRARLETVARRIGVLGEIHQQLYSSSNFAKVDIGEHLRRLGENLRQLHAHQSVVIGVDADPLLCDIEVAIPIGLIANELISNSLEHAFPDGRTGRVDVILRTLDGLTTLTVADDGIGGSGDGRTGLGLRLVQALGRQLGGTLETSGADGTRTTLTLPEATCAPEGPDGSEGATASPAV